jgi:hypothetical protein
VSNDALMHEFEVLLRTTQTRLRHATLRAAARVAVDRVLVTLACIAGAYCLLRLGCLVARRPVPLGWTAYAGLLAVGLMVPVLVTMIRALRHMPSLQEAAERLDLGTQDHNRIAIALALTEREDRGAFARAAIEDGLGFLNRLKDALPCLSRQATDRRTSLYAGLTFVAMSIVAALCGGAPASIAVAEGPGYALSRPSADRRPVAEPDNRRDPAKAAAPQSQPTMAGSKRNTEALAMATRPPAGLRNEPAAGRASGQTGAEAGASDRSASAKGDSTEATASSRSPKKKEAKASAPKRSKESQVKGAPKPEKPEESSSIGQGSAGGGSMSAVQNAWSSRDQTTEGDREEDESDEDAQDESESNTQRGGIQPSLKDRNEAPTKELGISGDEGPPGTGRGGPTPPKKSRGTASLVLGVPVPDFVRGRVGPGTTKVTHERVEPTPMPGDATSAVDAARRAMNEAATPRFDVPPSFAEIVRNYLVALHSADQKTPMTPTTPGGASKGPRP